MCAKSETIIFEFKITDKSGNCDLTCFEWPTVIPGTFTIYGDNLPAGNVRFLLSDWVPVQKVMLCPIIKNLNKGLAFRYIISKSNVQLHIKLTQTDNRCVASAGIGNYVEVTVFDAKEYP